MWTASGDSIILDEVNKLNILGYIKKESLGDRTADVNNSIKSLITLVDKGLEKKYLKEVWDIQKSITINNPKIQIEVKSIFEILDSDMKNRFIYAMFAIFKVIEIICNIYFEEKKIDEKWKAFWKDSDNSIYGYSTKDRLIEIRKKFTLDSKLDQEISDISEIRNNTIHSSNKNIEKPTKNHILTWFKMLQTILEKIAK